MLDIIIVGQGIAGSLLSWFLQKADKKFVVIDNHNLSNASRVASGVTNPVTGRRFVKTWMAEDLLAFAKATYSELETILQQRFYEPLPIIRLFDSIKAQNDWSARTSQTGYTNYLHNQNVVSLSKDKVKNDFGAFEINGGTRLETETFLSAYRNHLSANKQLIEEQFLFHELREHPDYIQYKNIKAGKIIFCDGAQAITNPYFKFLPFQLAKGECLILYIEDFYTDKMISSEAFVLPMGNNLYYVGSTHDWHFNDDKPSREGKQELLANLDAFIKAPYKIVGHRAAIRPTVNDRRPFIGFHPEHSRVGIFNGLGTKGISLAPFFAKHFSKHITEDCTLMPEVDIKRFS